MAFREVHFPGGEKELDIDTIENDSFWMGRGHENLLVSRHFVSVAMIKKNQLKMTSSALESGLYSNDVVVSRHFVSVKKHMAR